MYSFQYKSGLLAQYICTRSNANAEKPHVASRGAVVARLGMASQRQSICRYSHLDRKPEGRRTNAHTPHRAAPPSHDSQSPLESFRGARTSIASLKAVATKRTGVEHGVVVARLGKTGARTWDASLKAGASDEQERQSCGRATLNPPRLFFLFFFVSMRPHFTRRHLPRPIPHSLSMRKRLEADLRLLPGRDPRKTSFLVAHKMAMAWARSCSTALLRSKRNVETNRRLPWAGLDLR